MFPQPLDKHLRHNQGDTNPLKQYTKARCLGFQPYRFRGFGEYCEYRQRIGQGQRIGPCDIRNRCAIRERELAGTCLNAADQGLLGAAAGAGWGLAGAISGCFGCITISMAWRSLVYSSDPM